jgi:hypothetical protein
VSGENRESAPQAPAPGSPPAGLLSETRRLVVGLMDVQFRQMLTPRMLPTIYLLGIVLAAMLTLYLIVHGFRDGWFTGLVWLLLLGPAVFLALVGALRIGLEIVLAIFRLVVHVERLDEVAHTIQGQTEEIAEDLPRIQFWRAFSRSRKAE